MTNGTGHDPERFYHCDCLEGGYRPPCEDCADLRADLAAAIARAEKAERERDEARTMWDAYQRREVRVEGLRAEVARMRAVVEAFVQVQDMLLDACRDDAGTVLVPADWSETYKALRGLCSTSALVSGEDPST
jgi:transposase InsO family protein